MPTATNPITAALAKRCDSWNLRLDKLCFSNSGEAEAKTAALVEVRKCYQQVAEVYFGELNRSTSWLSALQRQHGEARFGFVDLVADSRLLLHLGRANVLENVGLYAERTTGLPIIPGTALKGVISTWACWIDHFNSDGSFRKFTKDSVYRRQFTAEEARLARRILGDDSATGSEHAGEVIFLGGFPITPPYLGLDIVNPHHEADGREKTRLTPNVFLCVEPDSSWRFAFFVRRGAPDASLLLSRTRTWIQEALTQTGIGAKTAAGYGRFRLANASDAVARKRWEQQVAACQAAAAKKAESDAIKAQQQAAAQATLSADYSNDESFKNRVLNKLNPGQLEQLRPEVELLNKAENESRRNNLKALLATKDYKDIRKRLRDKDWFPKDWLPPQ